ncbi:MAG: T9SS type A sorting domain-containing protein [Bacteroidetes bacterium]|nr:T9SS type A sorting domain-containing protein [Bacteroidota bacterium]
MICLYASLVSVSQSPDWQWQQAGGGSGFPTSTQAQPDYDRIFSSAIDNQGNVIVGGQTTRYPHFDSIQFTSSVNWANSNFFLAKYDKCGNILWARVGGGIGYDDISGVDVDGVGNIYVFGALQSTGSPVYINTPSKDTVLNNTRYFFGKFDSNGNLVYVKTFYFSGGSFWEHEKGMFKRLNNGLFLSVIYSSQSGSSIDGYPLTPDSRSFVLFDSLGNVVKRAQIDTISSTGSVLSKFVTDENDNIYFCIVNLTLPTVSFLSHVYNPAPQYTGFLLKTDTSFTIKDQNLSGFYQETIGYLSYSNGYLYGAGRNADGAIFDWDTTHTSLGTGKFTASKIDTNLNLIWVSRPSVESIDPSYTYILPGASKDNLYLGYQNRGTVVWDSANLVTAPNTYNMAILRLRTSDGKCVKGEFTGGVCTSKDAIEIIKTDEDGNGYFMGTFAGSIGTHTDSSFADGGASSPDYFILKWGISCTDTANSMNKPEDPTNLIATATGTQTINVTWNDVSAYEQGFHVYRSPNGINSWTLAGSTAHNVAVFNDAGLVLNTIYWYKAAAYNSGGESDFTNIDSAKTWMGVCSSSITHTNVDSVYTFSANPTGTAAFTYQWSLNGNNFSTAANPTLTLGTPGTYIICVTVTDAGSCISNDCDTVTVNPDCSGFAIVNTSHTNVSCFGLADATITTGANGGYAPYQFALNSGAYQSSNVFSGLTAGGYVIHIRDTFGCTRTSVGAVIISQPAQLTVSVSHTDVSTIGGNDGTATATVNGGTPAYSFAWSNNANSNPITGLTSGNYCVTVTDSHNCSVSTCVDINDPGCAGFAVSNVTHTDVSCFGSTDGTITVAATGGQTPYQYSLNSGAYQSLNSFAGLSAGNYTVHVRDTAGCAATYSSTIIITEPAQLMVSVSTTPVTTLGGNDGTATATVTGGTGSIVYNWNNGQTNNPIIGLIAGDYCVTVVDANNCTATACDSVVTVIHTCSTTISHTNADSLYTFITTNTGTPSFTYQWSLNGNNVSTSATLSQVIQTAGTYNICVTVTDANQCTSTACDTVTITVVGIIEPPDVDVNIFPNPTDDLLFINVNASHDLKTELQVTDLVGRVMLRSEVKFNAGNNQINISCKDLETGVYQVTLSSGNWKWNRSVVKL